MNHFIIIVVRALMAKCNLVIDGFDIRIEYPVYIKGMYKIYFDNVWIGYVYYRIDHLESPSKIWYATTDYTQLYLVELSLFLESVDP